MNCVFVFAFDLFVCVLNTVEISRCKLVTPGNNYSLSASESWGSVLGRKRWHEADYWVGCYKQSETMMASCNFSLFFLQLHNVCSCERAFSVTFWEGIFQLQNTLVWTLRAACAQHLWMLSDLFSFSSFSLHQKLMASVFYESIIANGQIR